MGPARLEQEKTGVSGREAVPCRCYRQTCLNLKMIGASAVNMWPLWKVLVRGPGFSETDA